MSAILSAATDPKLLPRDLHVVVVLGSHLDTREFRPVKQGWLARRLGEHQSHVSQRLKRLVERGYLERGPNEGQLGTYRLGAA